MSRVCFFIVGHGKLDCYEWQTKFFNKFNFIKDYDIIFYDNSSLTEEQIREKIQNLKCKNVKIFAQRYNAGYHLGQFYALNECFDILEKYSLVVHHTVDSFIINDKLLYDWLINFNVHDAGLLSNQFLFHPAHNTYITEPTMCYGTDIFVFNPAKLNKQFWTKTLTLGNIPPEIILQQTTKLFNILVLIWVRVFVTKSGHHLCAPRDIDLDGLDARFFADTMDILHTHNLSFLEKYL